MPFKRPAAANGKVSPTKRAKEDPVASKIRHIVEAITTAELPERTREMLVGCLPESLAVEMDCRHAHQQQIVEMVGETLNGIQKSIEKGIQELDAKVASADRERENREAALKKQTEGRDQIAKTVNLKKGDVARDHLAFREAEKSLAQAVAAQTSGDEELEETAVQKNDLEAAMRDYYYPLKEGAANKKLLNTLMTACKKFNFESSLLAAVSTALGQNADSRGSFDALTLTRFEDALTEKKNTLEKILLDGEPAKAQRAAAVSQAEGVRASASAARATTAKALFEAQSQEKSSEASVEEASTAVENFVPELEALQSHREAEILRLGNFREEPLAAFQELKERSTPPLELEQPEAGEEPTEVPVEPEETAVEHVAPSPESEEAETF